MISRSAPLILVLVLGFLAVPEIAPAKSKIAGDWRAQYPGVCAELDAASRDCTLCHDPGYALNPYAEDLLAADLDFLAVEGLDSDTDGRTNGQEIGLDCTLPGNVLSVPVRTETWSGIKALFR